MKDGSGRELSCLHDTAVQHLRALKAMGNEPSGAFITSTLELKLDTNNMFEWQRHSQSSTEVPHYKELLQFVDLRAQASESATSGVAKKSFDKNNTPPPVRKNYTSRKPVASFAASADSSLGLCIACKSEKHPLYVCTRFKSMCHSDKLSLLRSNGVCINCLRPGHYTRSCRSLHKCRVCQRPHHTTLSFTLRKGTHLL